MCWPQVEFLNVSVGQSENNSKNQAKTPKNTKICVRTITHADIMLLHV